jgi:nucleotide-binding universal stress UspA family protein
LLVAYVLWGGESDIEELVQRVTPPEPGASVGAVASEGVDADTDYFRVLVPVARPSNAPTYVRLAESLARGHDQPPLVQVLTVTQIPEQTPHEMVSDVASKRADRIAEVLAEEDHPVPYTVEGHTCRDIGFDILETARDDDADLILMGYPEESDEVTEKVEYKAPCDVVFTRGVAGDTIETVNLGAGGGPHHRAAIPMVRALGQRGTEVHIISVDPLGEGTPEDPAATVSALKDVENVYVHNVTAATIADGLVENADENGGVLVIGASRDRRLRQWVFGSTPDQVVEAADTAGVPIIVYASSVSVTRRLEDYLFPVYRYARKLVNSTRTTQERRLPNDDRVDNP